MVKTDKKSEEYLAFGSVYKNLRRAKGYTLNEAAGESTTGANISRFEAGKLMPTTNIFYAMLENIAIGMDEFQYEYNKHLRQKDVLLYNTEISTAYMTHNVVKLKSILKEIETMIETKRYTKKFLLDKIRVEAALSLTDPSNQVPQVDIDRLKNYLLKLQVWGHYDILLLGYTASLFDLGTLPHLISHMIDPAQPVIKFPSTEQVLIETLLNIIEVFIKNDQFTNAEKYITYLEDNPIHDYYMSEKLMLVYHKAHLAYRKGEQTALDTMKRCVEMLEFCKCYGMANMLEEEVAEIEAKGI